MSDEFNFDGKPSRQSYSRSSGGGMSMWDMLSILVLMLTGAIVVYFLIIFIFPTSSLNILPPGGSIPPTSTFTPVPIGFDATWTASPTLELTPSNTPRPTFTPFSTNTPFSLVPPTKTPRPPTATRTPKAPFSVIVNYVPSTIFYPELGCSYFGVAGEAVDVNTAPYKFGIIKLGGTINGQTIDPNAHTTVTGVATQFGVGGFELVLNMPPTDSKGTLWIQMFDVAGIPQSEQKPINTYADCQKNLVQVRFKGNR